MTNSNTSTVTTNSTMPIVASSSDFTAFVLRRLRCAELRVQIIGVEIKEIRTALTAGLISPEIAILGLHECGALVLIPTSSRIA